MERSNLKTIVRGAYDIQKLRIMMGNRIVGNFKAKLGQKPSESEDTLDMDAQDIIKTLRVSYKKITDGVTSFPRQKTFKGDEVISNFTELALLDEYFELERAESTHFRRLGMILREFPIWNDFMDDVKGVGPAMAGVIISEINIHTAEYPSSLHKYAGLDVVKGEGRGRFKHHLEESTYTDKDGAEQTKMGITFNPFLKTKLIGVLGSSFIKQKAETSPYRSIYDSYKHRLENHPKHKEKTKGHRHNMAVRYMVKKFLTDLYNAWRRLEGLTVAPTYEEAKLGMTHGSASKYAQAEAA
jgi:hypothetical protein